MGTVAPEELLRSWIQEKMPIEMTMGHILQNLVKMYTDIAAIHDMLYTLGADVDGLIVHTGMKPRSKSKKKPLRKG